MMILGILVPTLKKRRDFLKRLMARLEPQLSNDVGVFTLEDDGVETTGAKRQRLIETVDTPFVAHVDDDDLVGSEYCAKVLTAISQGADVVGFKVRYYEDGVHIGNSNHSLQNERWDQTREPDGLFQYRRTPNHLNPIRREIALQVGFKNKTVGEDADYSTRLYDEFGKSMKEVFIDDYLYEYFFRTRVRSEPPMYDKEGALTIEAMKKTIAEGGSVLYRGQLCTTLAQLGIA